MRHYVRLSRNNYAIDAGLYPLGSCTMKHNPRLNEKMARLPGFADAHPLQPVSTAQGALELIKTLAGLSDDGDRHERGRHVAEGGRAWRAMRHDGDQGGDRRARRSGDAQRRARAGFRAWHQSRDRGARSAFPCGPCRPAPTGRSARPRCATALRPDVAAIMLTNPNTCGLFEREIVEIAAAMHEAGAYFYCDGANFNAIVGKTRPGDLGVDAMHINLHKTFSTPHGGGGPGAGPVVLSARLAPFAPVPYVVERDGRLELVEHARGNAVVRPHDRLPRPDGHVRARARLHPVAWRRRPAAGLRGRGARRPITCALRCRT